MENFILLLGVFLICLEQQRYEEKHKKPVVKNTFKKEDK